MTGGNDGDRDLWYTACPDCRKKVNPSDGAVGAASSHFEHGRGSGGGGGQGWYCERCTKTFPDCNFTYNFSVRIGDFSNYVYTQVLGEQVGDAIMGMSARDLKALKESCGDVGMADPGSFAPPMNEFRQLLNSKEMQPAMFLVRAKVDTYT